MTLPNDMPESKPKVEDTLPHDCISIDANKIQNSVLQRLIDEVKCESQNNISAYNRLHNRHNRTR